MRSDSALRVTNARASSAFAAIRARRTGRSPTMNQCQTQAGPPHPCTTSSRTSSDAAVRQRDGALRPSLPRLLRLARRT